MPNGISNSYQLDQSISILRVFDGVFFKIYSNFNRTYCKQGIINYIKYLELSLLELLSVIIQIEYFNAYLKNQTRLSVPLDLI